MMRRYDRRSYGRRNRSRLRNYNVFCNGVFVGTSVGANSRAALMHYCKYHGVPFANGASMGACGYELMNCAANGYGVRPCGSTSKCKPIYAVQTPDGVLMAHMVW